MRKKIFIWVCIVFFASFAAIFSYVKVYGKSILSSGLSEAFSEEVSFMDVSYHFPVGLSASNIKVGHFLQIEKIDAQFVIFSLLSKNIVLSRVKLIRPVFIIQESKELKTLESNSAELKSVPLKSIDKSVSHPWKIQIKELSVLDGVLQYIGETEKKSFHLTQLALNLRNLYLPLESVKTQYDLKGVFQKEDKLISNMEIGIDGWTNFLKKNMGGYFWIGDEEKLVKARGSIVSVENTMTVKGNIILSKEKEFLAESLSEKSMIENMILKGLEITDIGLKIDFSFDTEMDDFEIKKVSFSGNVLEKEQSDSGVNVLLNKNVVVK